MWAGGVASPVGRGANLGSSGSSVFSGRRSLGVVGVVGIWAFERGWSGCVVIGCCASTGVVFCAAFCAAACAAACAATCAAASAGGLSSTSVLSAEAISSTRENSRAVLGLDGAGGSGPGSGAGRAAGRAAGRPACDFWIGASSSGGGNGCAGRGGLCGKDGARRGEGGASVGLIGRAAGPYSGRTSASSALLGSSPRGEASVFWARYLSPMGGKRSMISPEKRAVISGEIAPTSGRHTMARCTVRRTRPTSVRVGAVVSAMPRPRPGELSPGRWARSPRRRRVQGESVRCIWRTRRVTDRAMVYGGTLLAFCFSVQHDAAMGQLQRLDRGVLAVGLERGAFPGQGVGVDQIPPLRLFAGDVE